MSRLAGLVAERLQRRVEELNATMNQAIEEGIEELDDRGQSDLLHASVDGNLATILHMLRNNVPVERLQPIAAATEYAIFLADRDVPATTLRRAYHFGSDDLLAHMFEEVQQLDVEPDIRLRLLHHLAGWMHSYVDLITRIVVAAHDDERRLIHERNASIAASTLRAVLDETAGAETEFLERTGYRLQQHHVAAVLWIAGTNPGVDHTEELRVIANALSKDTGSSAPLFTAVDRGTAWVWFGRAGNAGQLDRTAVERVIRLEPRARLALGRTCAGVEGFRQSHRQANAVREILSVARAGHQVHSHEDRAVSIVSMMVDDIPDLSSWVADVLGPLADNTDNAARLRTTLLAFLTSGGNYQQTADQLTLHRNTVKYRIGRAIEARGRKMADDRLDLELALNVVDILGEAVLARP